jgi:hypothetical protein
MPDAVVLDATNKILDVGLVSAFLILALAALVVRERYWDKKCDGAQKAHDATIKEWRESDDAMRANFYALFEGLRDQMREQTAVTKEHIGKVDAALELLRDRDRRAS